MAMQLAQLARLDCTPRAALAQVPKSWRPKPFAAQHPCRIARVPTRLRPLLATAEEPASPADAPLVAVEGDVVTLHWECLAENGEVLESSRAANEPTSFEVGAGDVVGNNIFQAFDEAVRGLAVGDKARIKAEGGEWKEELLFVVPRDHEEIERLENRYKNVGGLAPSLVVQLSNGGMAMVLEADEEKVVLDANSALAGKSLTFELELINIERGS